MLGLMKRFSRREDGAVTVDWVVFTAAVAGMCIAFVLELKNDANGLSQRLTLYFLADALEGIPKVKDLQIL